MIFLWKGCMIFFWWFLVIFVERLRDFVYGEVA